MKTGVYLECPKCKRHSGDDWEQCKGSCPVLGSPHYSAKAEEKYGGLVRLIITKDAKASPS
jgi:hypothetical protein